MRFGKDSYNLLMKSSGIAKKAVLHASQSSSRLFGFVFHASSFILPQTCSMMFMSGDWAGQSWSTLIFFALRNFDVCDGAPSCCKIWPLMVFDILIFDILDYWCCLPPCRSLAHPHVCYHGCNPRPWFFRHQTWLFSGWILDPCGLQLVSCNISSDCNVIQQKMNLRNPPSATFPASILLAGCGPHGFLIVFCSVLVSGHWFDHGGHFETESDKLLWLTRGLQVTRSRGALLQWKRGWPWIFEPTNGPPERFSCGVCLS